MQIFVPLVAFFLAGVAEAGDKLGGVEIGTKFDSSGYRKIINTYYKQTVLGTTNGWLGVGLCGDKVHGVWFSVSYSADEDTPLSMIGPSYFSRNPSDDMENSRERLREGLLAAGWKKAAPIPGGEAKEKPRHWSDEACLLPHSQKPCMRSGATQTRQ
jgi:hypothetical protein